MFEDSLRELMKKKRSDKEKMMKDEDRISENNQEEIIAKLEEIDLTLPCPRCGNSNFILTDGYSSIPVRGNISEISIGGRAIPCIMTICNKCGYISMHSLGILGLMDMAKESGDDGKGIKQDKDN